MKKVAVGLMVYLVLLAVARVDAVKQRIPIAITGSEVNQAGTVSLRTTNVTTSVSNQLVMAIDLAANTIEIEEWDAALSNRVDRQPAGGTQSLVLASYIMAKTVNSRTNTFTFAADMETGDPVDVDWNNDGTNDTFAAISFLGTISYKPTGILTNRNGTSFVTGVVTRVNARMMGVLNDSINSSNGVDRILRSGNLRSTKPAFLVDEVE
jgi:hypothetical protein